MPVIRVWGTRQREEVPLEHMRRDMQQAVSAIPELKLEPEQVTVLFPRENASNDLGETLIIEVVNLNGTPERTPEVLDRLEEKLLNSCRNSYSRVFLLQACRSKPKLQAIPPTGTYLQVGRILKPAVVLAGLFFCLIIQLTHKRF